MTISLQYVGTAKHYFETPATGRARSWRVGQQQDVSDTDAALLLATGQFSAAPAPAGQTWISVGGSFTLSAADDGKCFAATAALTVTIPTGLSPRPSVVLMPPPSGNLSITGTLNGSSQTLTRSRAANQAGVAVNAYQDADNYGVSGS